MYLFTTREGLAEFLLKQRTDRGWSLSQLAEVTGLPVSTAVNAETGKHRPQVNTLAKLVKAYGLQVALVEEQEDKQ
jgi:transcriptional regulator with XRE-family HTH domain